ncbi:conserved domain protein [Peptoniphilus sp. oral taxon 375 str. F0436]|nr:conserved domain protein [Peptoniphilus sp. oral taxon 375 str. F0436]
MPNSISPHFFMLKLIIKTQKYYKNKNSGYQRGQISLYKVRGILSSFYKNQNTLKCEYS